VIHAITAETWPPVRLRQLPGALPARLHVGSFRRDRERLSHHSASILSSHEPRHFP
jgi:hypothetical protein